YALIKAISKKKAKVIDANRPVFIEGAGTKGLDKKAADELFELILKFAGYGFNKSHSTGYAIVAYQTAYLKTFFPAQYMAAFLSFESQAQKVADWLPYLEDCKRTVIIDPATGQQIRRGIEVMAPEVNLSEADFSVVFEEGEPRDAQHGHIRFGLKAIKGAGAKAIDSIVGERDGGPYTSLFDFCERVPPGTVNKATIEALIKAGAFDSVHGRERRSALVGTIDAAVSAGHKAAEDKAAGQNQLFGFGGEDESPAATDPATSEAPLAAVPAWSEAETLRQEKDTLGFYVSSHPLEEWSDWTRVFTRLDCGSLRGLPQDKPVIVAAMIQSARVIVCRNGRSAGQKMAILTVEDAVSTAEAVCFAEVYGRYSHLLEGDEAGEAKFVMGRLDHSRGDPQIIVDRIVPIEGRPLDGGTLLVTLRASRLNGGAAERLDRVRMLLDDFTSETAEAGKPGSRMKLEVEGKPIAYHLLVETDDAWIRLEPESKARVKLESDLVRGLANVLGPMPVELIGGVSIDMQKKDPREKYRKRA
ncbi:MAG: hypothetical protein AAFU70_05060, partial [Planctomycetota bacterium]